MIHEQKHEYWQIKEFYLGLLEGKMPVKRARNVALMYSELRAWEANLNNWYGCDSKQMAEWLRQGYRSDKLILYPPIQSIRKKRKIKWGEEGDLQYDLAISGYDYPYIDWEKRPIMPGMKVEITAGFSSGVNSNVVVSYYRWILRALVALESDGIDTEVWLSSTHTNVFNRFPDDRLAQKFLVKKEGEQSDYLSWSPMLSPGGWRHLGFMMIIIDSDLSNRDAVSSLGRAINTPNSWHVGYNPETMTLSFSCPYNATSFPEEEMEIKLRELLLNARRMVA